MIEVNLKTECMTHRKEAAIAMLWSGTIKSTVEKWSGVKRGTEERRLGRAKVL